MDKKYEYFVKKINQAIKDKNFQEAKYYYEKAISFAGQLPEIESYKSTIDDGILSIPNKLDEEQNKKPHKPKTINEKLIIIPIVIMGIIGFLIYFFVDVYPVNHLISVLDGTWYQGDVSTSHSEGLKLNISDQGDRKIKIKYEKNGGGTIDTIEGKIINGHTISVYGFDNVPIEVTFEEKNEIVVFSPSFLDLSKTSRWKKYDIFGDNEVFNVTNSNSSNENDELIDTSNNTSIDNTSKNHNVDSNTNTIPCANGHNWVEVAKTVHHEEVGHYENVVVNYISLEKYQCSYCEDEKWYNSLDEITPHFSSVHGISNRDQILQCCYTSYDRKPVYEKRWVVDQEAYDETVTTGYKCSVCGKTK